MWTLIMLLMGIAAILVATLTAHLEPAVPDPLLTAQAIDPNLVDFSTAPTFIVYGQKGISLPSSFQTAPDTFTIPKSGNYRISSNLTVTETSGSPSTVIHYAQVNGTTNLVLGLDTVRDNGSLTFTGDIVTSLNAGDKVQMVVTQYFGGSTGIGYQGAGTNGTETFYLTNVSFQYIKS
jgi:hypothetical protein